MEEDIRRILAESETLRLRLLELVEEDALAFTPMTEAYAIPKEDPSRQAALEAAAMSACRPPLEMVECCGRIVALLEEMLEKGNRLLITDVGCGALLCRAAMECSAMNVYVNTSTLRDRETAARLESRVEQLLATWLPRAERVAASVTAYIRKEA